MPLGEAKYQSGTASVSTNGKAASTATSRAADLVEVSPGSRRHTGAGLSISGRVSRSPYDTLRSFRTILTVSKRVAIVQSSYVPWKGFFDLIRSVDEFILLDEVQFTRRDWRSRNRIKTQHGVAW